MAHLGYGRVSTEGQSLTAQVAEKAAGCTEIFQEKISGAKSDRKQLARLIARLGCRRCAGGYASQLSASTSPNAGAVFSARVSAGLYS